MIETHLTPTDIEVVVDDDSAPAAVAFMAHIKGCDRCRVALDEARFVAEMLSTAPHLKPPREFTDKVMTQVQVSEPWHVSAVGALRGLWPERGAARALMATAAVLAGIVTTMAVLALALRSDEATMLGAMLGGRWRATLGAQASRIVESAFGGRALDLLHANGWSAVAVAVPLFLVTAGVALAGLGAAGARARERRS